MDLKSYYPHLSHIWSLSEQLIHSISIAIIETVCNTEIAKHLPLLVLQSDLRVTNNQEKGIIRHTPFARNYRKRSAIVEAHDQAAFVCYCFCAYGWLTVTCQVETRISLDDDCNLGYIICISVKIWLGFFFKGV